MCLLPACHQPTTEKLYIEPAALAACQPPAFDVVGFVAEALPVAGFAARADPELFAAREVPEAVLAAARGVVGLAVVGLAAARGVVGLAAARGVVGLAVVGLAAARGVVGLAAARGVVGLAAARGVVGLAVDVLVAVAVVSRPMGRPIIVATRFARESRLVNPRSDSWSCTSERT